RWSAQSWSTTRTGSFSKDRLPRPDFHPLRPGLRQFHPRLRPLLPKVAGARRVTETPRFGNACVASPHHLASSAGLAVLASGGNALDAAIATNLTLGVVTPYLCGFGGDLFAMIWTDGRLF